MLHRKELTLSKQPPSSSAATFQPPHTHSSSLALQCIEEFMRLTHDHPDLMKNIVYLGGASALLLITAPWLLPVLAGAEISTGATIASVAAGVTVGATSLTVGYAQHNILGFPTDTVDYVNSEVTYKDATAKLIVDKDHFPLLRINANESYSAGYVEGYILGKQINIALTKLDSIYSKLQIALGLPNSQDTALLRKHLTDVLATIPEKYKQEIQGKVDGYNEWLKKNKPGATPLSFEFYFLMQLQPDIHNYNPLPIRPLGLDFGCTSMVFRIGDYTVFNRVLDWPSFGIANYFLQVERHIQGSKVTIDIGFPLVTGLLTAVNENGLLIEINVAHGAKVEKPEGMPSLFFNRYCAENASSVDDIHRILKEKQPLGAYHMTASNGVATNSFHFYQSLQKRNEHVIDTLDTSKRTPTFLAVANPSVAPDMKGSQVCVYNYKDSQERLANAKAFFDQAKLQAFIDKQQGNKTLTPDDIKQLEEIALQMARLPLINNCGSTLCALYVFYKDQLIDARAVTDNNFVQDKPLSSFKKLAH